MEAGSAAGCGKGGAENALSDRKGEDDLKEQEADDEHE